MEQPAGQNESLNPLYKEKVHVAFLGWEIERIVRPILEMRGNRLILICFPQDKEGAWDYLVEIKQQLEAKSIKVEVIKEDLYNLVDLLAILNKVLQIEKLRKNDIFINVSAGTKITACASTIAAMSTPNITAYYVSMKKYYPKDNPAFREKNRLETLTTEFQGTTTIPFWQIAIPEQKYIKTLHTIKQRIKNDNDKIFIKDLIDILKVENVINVKYNKERRKETSSEYMAIKPIIEKLEAWEYITVSPRKRNKYLQLTEKGKNAIRMYLSYELEMADLKENDGLSIDQWITKLKKRE
nr:DUF6293 family protein [Candidatus Sigynarchaeota archaeon]